MSVQPVVVRAPLLKIVYLCIYITYFKGGNELQSESSSLEWKTKFQWCRHKIIKFLPLNALDCFLKRWKIFNIVNLIIHKMIIHLNRTLVENWWLTVVLLFVVNSFTESILNETVTFYTLDLIIKLPSLLTVDFY